MNEKVRNELDIVHDIHDIGSVIIHCMCVAADYHTDLIRQYVDPFAVRLFQRNEKSGWNGRQRFAYEDTQRMSKHVLCIPYRLRDALPFYSSTFPHVLDRVPALLQKLRSLHQELLEHLDGLIIRTFGRDVAEHVLLKYMS